MIAWLTAKIGKSGAILIAVAALLAIAGAGAWGTVREIRSVIDSAVASGKAERDAYWRSKIEQASRRTAETVVEQMKQSARIEDEAQTKIERLQNQLTQREKTNAVLPDNSDCGLGRDRVRLLNDQPGGHREK